MTTYRLVFIGASGHYPIVLSQLPHFPNVQFVAYAPSFEGEDLSPFARWQGGRAPRAYGRWEAMLDAEKPDIVTVCGRYDLNASLSMAAAERGSHIVSDKPAAQNLEDLAQLRRLVLERAVHYGIMLTTRYEAPYFTAHRLAQQGVIGEPYLITAQKSYRWGNNRPAWYADPLKYGNSMTWVGIHAFDYARWIAGVEYAEVAAFQANRVHTERPGCQDVATVMARLTNGGFATFNLDYLRPEAAATHGDDRLRVAGSQGVLEIRDEGRRLQVTTKDKDVASWPLEQSGRSLLGDLLLAIEGQGSLLVTPQEAFDITAFAIQAARAADEHHSIALANR